MKLKFKSASGAKHSISHQPYLEPQAHRVGAEKVVKESGKGKDFLTKRTRSVTFKNSSPTIPKTEKLGAGTGATHTTLNVSPKKTAIAGGIGYGVYQLAGKSVIKQHNRSENRHPQVIGETY